MFGLLLKELFVNIAIPVATNVVKSYVQNTSSKKDDTVLELTQIGATYLANKTNNNVAIKVANELKNSSMIQIQRAR